MDEKIHINEIKGKIESVEEIKLKNADVEELVKTYCNSKTFINLEDSIKMSDIECPNDEWIFYVIAQLFNKPLDEVLYWPIGPVMMFNNWLSDKLKDGDTEVKTGLEWEGRYFMFHKDAKDIPVGDYYTAEDAFKAKDAVGKTIGLLSAFFTETDDKGNPIPYSKAATDSKKEFFKTGIPYGKIKPYQIFFLNSYNTFESWRQNLHLQEESQAEILKTLESLSSEEVEEWKSLVSAMETWKKQTASWPIPLANGFIAVRCYLSIKMHLMKTWKQECAKTGKSVWNIKAFFKWYKEKQDLTWNHPNWKWDYWKDKYFSLIESNEKLLEQIKTQK